MKKKSRHVIKTRYVSSFIGKQAITFIYIIKSDYHIIFYPKYQMWAILIYKSDLTDQNCKF